MRKKRIFPFGYQMQDGQVVVHPQEAGLVREIFQQYQRGRTTPELAASAMLQGIPYREETAIWNKNMVCRILDDARYTGTGEYPPIVEQTLYDAVCTRRSSGRKKKTALPKEIRKKTICPQCGRTLCRTACRHGTITWGCPDCGRESGWLKDSQFLGQITALLNRLIAEPTLAERIVKKPDFLSSDVQRLSREFNRKLGNPKSDADELLYLIQQCAQEKYRMCVASGWENQRIRECLTGQQPMETPDMALFEKIVKSVIVSGSEICLWLTNGVILS